MVDSERPAPGGGFTRAVGIELVRASAEEVVMRLQVDERHWQPMGIVHGGVYCALVETACSIGATQAAMPHGRYAVGLDNQTSFLRAVREGTLEVVARPIKGGKRTALWEASIQREDGVTVARGQLRLLTVEAGSELAGKAAGLQGADG